MFTFVLLAFLIYRLFADKNLKDLIAIPIIFLTGFLISSAYILPLMFEKHFFNLKAFIGEGGGFHYGHFFILPKLTEKLPPDHFWPVYYYSTVFYLFLFITLLLLFLYQTKQLQYEEHMSNVKTMNHFFLGAVFVSIFFSFGVSTFLWETIPFMKYIQFPTRWFNITAYSLIFLSAVNFSSPETIYRSKKSYLIIFVLFLTCFLLSLKYIKSAPYFSEHELIPVKSVDLTSEHLPAWVDIHKIDNQNDMDQQKTVIIEGAGKAENIFWKSAERIIDINADSPLKLKVKTFYFPGWRAYIDNQATNIRKEDGTGALIIGVPSGHHSLKLVFADTPIRYYSKIMTLISFLAVIVIFISSNLKGRSARNRYL
jgi:hypothetical protein